MLHTNIFPKLVVVSHTHTHTHTALPPDQVDPNRFSDVHGKLSREAGWSTLKDQAISRSFPMFIVF